MKQLELRLLDTAAAIVGRTGSGKSYLARGLVERLLFEQRRVCVVDPTGAWWGLRRLLNGKSGFDVVIFGGDHADVPITDKSGKALGELVAEGRVPACIVDVSDMSNNEQTRFLTDFLEAIYHKNRAPLHLVLDEADVMAPQNPLPEQRRLQGAVNKIVRRGRIKGFRPLLITQRPQVIDKSVLSQSNTLIAMRLTSPQDRKAIEEWVKGNADAGEMSRVVGSLASLKVGEGWVWAPADDLLVKMSFPPNKTHDSSKAPDHGDEAIEPFELKSLDLEELRDALGSIEEPATTSRVKGGKAADEIGWTTEQLNEAEKRGYERGYEAGQVRGHADALKQVSAALVAIGRDIPIQSSADPEKPALEQSLTRPEASRPVRRDAPPRRSSSAIGVSFNSAAQKLLAALDTNPPVKRTWGQAATLAGLKARGGHFNSGKKQLIEAGMVVEEGALIRIANPSAGAEAPPDDPAQLVIMWSKALSGAAPKILGALFDMGGRALRGDLAEHLGMKPQGGHWNSGWKELRDNEIVTVGKDDVATLTELFMPKKGTRK